AHERPVGIELVGHERCEARRISLTHLVMLADYRDQIVAAHAHKCVRCEWSGGGAFYTRQRSLGTAGREPAETDDEAGRAGTLEKHAARRQRSSGFLRGQEFHEPMLFIRV